MGFFYVLFNPRPGTQGNSLNVCWIDLANITSMKTTRDNTIWQKLFLNSIQYEVLAHKRNSSTFQQEYDKLLGMSEKLPDGEERLLKKEKLK